jgi:hypothetical protein
VRARRRRNMFCKSGLHLKVQESKYHSISTEKQESDLKWLRTQSQVIERRVHRSVLMGVTKKDRQDPGQTEE